MRVEYQPPTQTFPYRISRRLYALSVPRRYYYDTMEGMPEYTERGIRMSALRGEMTDRVRDMAWPWIRRLIVVKKTYRNKFSPDRLERIDRMIEAANATVYSKFAKCYLDFKKVEGQQKKKRGWTETDWKKHMEYIGQVAAPKKEFKPPPVERGKSKPLEALLPRINYMISSRPEYKLYRRMSQESWYKPPGKVSPNALKYVISERIKLLATPRVIRDEQHH